MNANLCSYLQEAASVLENLKYGIIRKFTCEISDLKFNDEITG